MKYIDIDRPLYPVGTRFKHYETGFIYMVTKSDLSYRSVFVDDSQRYLAYDYQYSLINVDNTSPELGFGVLISETVLTDQWIKLEDAN